MSPFALPSIRFRPGEASSAPIYSRLAAALAEAIRAGRIAVGSRLPSERVYAEQLGVSRTTVTAAYQELRALGLIRGYVGRGAIVIADDADPAAGAIPWISLGGRAGQGAFAGASPNAISFANGWLHPTLVPHAALVASAVKAGGESANHTVVAPIAGLPSLRDALAQTLRANGVKAEANDVLVTGGAQHGLSVIARALLSPGDVVVCETPTWHGAVGAFRAAGAAVVGVATDGEGVDPDALEDALARSRPKFAYLIPTFHCPTGRVLGIERRRKILEICTRLRTPIVESHVYGDLGFGETPPPLKSLDTSGIVIHQGSVSKTLAAALRIGWLVAPPGAFAMLAAAKASFDLCTPVLPQATLAHVLASGAYRRHLPALRKQLEARRDATIRALAKHCPQVRFETPEGGIYLWVRLPKPLAGHAVEAAAAAAGLALRDGAAFLPQGGSSNFIRLCYAAPDRDDIDTGIMRLGGALQSLFDGSTTSFAEPSAFAPV